ncbi:MAG TPA: hypothetical protein VJN01_10440, partial [Xanthomonadales bacterium]|nr:hypothetical protein [Xanthomonadales bacterium]
MKKLVMTTMMALVATAVGCKPNAENVPEGVPDTTASMVSQCEALADTQLGHGTVTDATHVEPGEE